MKILMYSRNGRDRNYSLQLGGRPTLVIKCKSINFINSSTELLIGFKTKEKSEEAFKLLEGFNSTYDGEDLNAFSNVKYYNMGHPSQGLHVKLNGMSFKIIG